MQVRISPAQYTVSSPRLSVLATGTTDLLILNARLESTACITAQSCGRTSSDCSTTVIALWAQRALAVEALSAVVLVSVLLL